MSIPLFLSKPFQIILQYLIHPYYLLSILKLQPLLQLLKLLSNSVHHSLILSPKHSLDLFLLSIQLLSENNVVAVVNNILNITIILNIIAILITEERGKTDELVLVRDCVR